jgi:curved DNA-binding protein CbpA
MVIFEGMPVSSSHYEILKVPADATPEQIQASYRNLCRMYHPDRSPGDPRSHEMMARINVSYEVLSDPALRAEYDSALAKERPPAPVVEETVAVPDSPAEASRFFMPSDDEEEPRPAGKSFRRQRVHHETEHRDATQAFLLHFTKRILLIGIVAAVAIYLIIAAGADDEDSGGWLILRALRRVFFNW